MKVLEPLLLALLDRYPSHTYVVLDADTEGVVMPEGFDGLQTLYVNVADPRVVQDLTINDKGIICLMSFNMSPFRIFAPWAAVHSISVPGLLVVTHASGALDGPDEPPPEPTGKPKLSLVKG